MNSLSLNSSLRRIVLEAFVLCVLSAAVGLSLNFKLIFNPFSGKAISAPGTILNPAPALPIPVALVEIDELDTHLFTFKLQPGEVE